MREKRDEQQLLFISIFFMALLCFPFVKMANKPVSILGVPLLYFYVFAVTIVFVFITWLLSNTKKPKHKNKI